MNNHSLRDTFTRLGSLAKYQYFSVVGMPKSGTTWCRSLLDSHDQIICHGETNLRQCWEKPVHTCIENYNDGVNRSGFDKVYFGNRQEDFLFLCGVLFVMNAWVMERNSDQIRHIGEQSPNYMAGRMRNWKKYFPKTKFLHIIRDPRDAAVSNWYFFTRLNPGIYETKFGTVDRFFDYYLGEWVKQVDACREFVVRTPERYLEYRYEELVHQPVETLTKILTFIGASSDPKAVNKCLERASFEKLTGRRLEDENLAGHKHRKGIVGDWKNHLNIELVNSNYGNVLSKYGY